MRRDYFLFGLLTFSNLVFSQNQFSSKIKSDCEVMNKAMKSNKYEIILDYTYPKIIEMGGGRKKIASSMEVSFEKMKDEGFVFENMIIGEPNKLYRAGNELHCIVPKETIMKTPKGRIKADYYLMGISNDEGKKWYFIETHMLTKENIKLIFPKFNYDLEIPKNSKPILID